MPASSEEFARVAPEVCAMIQAWIAHGEDATTPAIPESTPQALRKRIDAAWPMQGMDDAALLGTMQLLLENSINPWTERFMAKLYSAPSIASVCGEMLLAAMNASVHVYSASPALSTVEDACAAQLAALFDFAENADGITMPGGAASNTLAVQTALCAAFDGTYRRDGVYGLVEYLHRNGRQGRGARPALLTSAASHFSLDRAALAAGLGMDAVVHVPVDAHDRMRVDALAAILDAMTRDPSHPNGAPFFVNATSGTTVLGAFDDIEAIAHVCAKYHCWLHVDASWGGAAVFSPAQRSALLRGSGMADSITINPHKLLCVTHQCSFLLVRDARVLREHAIHAGYLFHERGPVVDHAMKTLGCGRRGEALKLYLTWCRHGTAGLAAHIDAGLAVARHVLAQIQACPLLELGPLAEPLFLQICFRPVQYGSATGSAATHKLHAALQAERQFAVDFAPTAQGDFMRLVVHPRTPQHIFSALLERILALLRSDM
ncbi:glutamate decarboxylase [Malassezia vespertilionis]|uniref:Uncharacterized protein n=1 Tax=Malassezia vespertilionis TaxID=2020962 RepID=A0A2N1JEH0_9BASI|nr:glutamate decarboxylase [Malassezia vespertilionis]PKI84944.1 hypothetical protein MVES_000915 [Malassezia vespertilionis]WFD05643.1 glutamate decarboxylase [Malassezia vespertilionis]